MYLQGAFDEYPLWIREVYLWPALTLPGRDWTFWQYSDKGRLEGYQGEEEWIDLNVFHGGEEEFARCWSRYSPTNAKTAFERSGLESGFYHARGAAGSVDFNVARGDAVSVTRAAGSVNPSIAPQATAQR